MVRAHVDELRRARPLSSAQEKVLHKIAACRTAVLGGHVDACDQCGHARISYNSCRDRHCPKCQGIERAAWLEKRLQRLLPVPYFHLVFTLPEELHPLALGNKRVVFGILFTAAAATLRRIARDPRHLGAEIGVTTVLHTWGQKLLFHPHLHCVVTGGGLALDGTSWVPAREQYLFPVQVLSQVFRGKFLDALERARVAGELRFGRRTADLADSEQWKAWKRRLYSKSWVVYAKPPFGGPERVFRYLGRYTHRVAISNHRIVEFADAHVTFAWKDYADDCKRKLMTLGAVEFLRRFLLHVLPKGLVRIRHYGLHAGCNVTTKLAVARGHLALGPPASPIVTDEPPKLWWERLLELTGVDVMACPHCSSGRMVRVELVPCEVAPSELIGVGGPRSP